MGKEFVSFGQPDSKTSALGVCFPNTAASRAAKFEEIIDIKFGFISANDIS
jgi:hypothetical protein